MMTFRPHLLFVLVATACALSATPRAAQEAPPADDLALAPRISTAELKSLVARGEVLVLDVRDREAYRKGHIPGAVSLPLTDIPARAAALGNEKRPIVTYCA